MLDSSKSMKTEGRERPRITKRRGKPNAFKLQSSSLPSCQDDLRGGLALGRGGWGLLFLGLLLLPEARRGVGGGRQGRGGDAEAGGDGRAAVHLLYGRQNLRAP